MIEPQQIGPLLRRARQAWALSPAELAQRAQVSEMTIRGAERNGRASLSDLAALAGALGGSLDDLLAGREFWNATSIAFKTSEASFELSVVCARVIALSNAANCERALSKFLALPPQWPHGAVLGPRSLDTDVIRQAEVLARSVRDTVGAGSEPLSSLREVSARLGVIAFLTDLGTDLVDGLMWKERNSAPCIAANVAARSGASTAIRMTLAHELCHALFDRPKSAAAGILEQRTDDAGGREPRANAFAAYLIAPRDALRGALTRLGWTQPQVPTSQHLRSLAQFFGMGVEAMAYHLVNCGVWTRSEALKRKTFSVTTLAMTIASTQLRPLPSRWCPSNAVAGYSTWRPRHWRSSASPSDAGGSSWGLA
jgi:Zn-dependent peptidase ImmA (M78 family)/transcriptional regulator with XRE-family HTH domain